MGDASFLGLGEIEGEINVTKNQRGLNQDLCWQGE